jgi:hypothetical protein
MRCLRIKQTCKAKYQEKNRITRRFLILIYTLQWILLGHCNEDDEMHTTTYGNEKCAQNLTQKPRWRRPLGELGSYGRTMLTIDCKEMRCDSIDIARPMASFYEFYHKQSFLKKCKFLY